MQLFTVQQPSEKKASAKPVTSATPRHAEKAEQTMASADAEGPPADAESTVMSEAGGSAGGFQTASGQAVQPSAAAKRRAAQLMASADAEGQDRHVWFSSEPDRVRLIPGKPQRAVNMQNIIHDPTQPQRPLRRAMLHCTPVHH